METTRHYTGTVYVVADGATALHSHKRMEIRIPPGGHVDRGELPHEATIRECDTAGQKSMRTRSPTDGRARSSSSVR